MVKIFKGIERIIMKQKNNNKNVITINDQRKKIIETFKNNDTINDLIEKMAVWYELRYTDDRINEIIPYTSFSSYHKLKHNQDDNWSEFFSFDKFLSLLSDREKSLIKNPVYKRIVVFHAGYLYLEPNGIISSVFFNSSGIRTSFCDIVGKHITELALEINEYIEFENQNKDVFDSVKNYELWNEMRNKVLDLVMLRIIERGGNRVGARRALLFAKEFNRNIDIPMIYGYDFDDSKSIELVNKYLEFGGKEDIKCYVSYFKENYELVSIEDIIRDNSSIKKKIYV